MFVCKCIAYAMKTNKIPPFCVLLSQRYSVGIKLYQLKTCILNVKEFCILLGQQDLIIVDEAEDEKDLMSFDEPLMEDAKKKEKVVVVAKHISTTQSNSFSSQHTTTFDNRLRKRKIRVKHEPVENVDDNETQSHSQLSPSY